VAEKWRVDVVYVESCRWKSVTWDILRGRTSRDVEIGRLRCDIEHDRGRTPFTDRDANVDTASWRIQTRRTELFGECAEERVGSLG
jgi:hypothetical protein